MKEAYTYPINAGSIMKAQKLRRMSTEESVRKHIYLILMTNLGEYRFDKSYGNALWDIDFDVSTNKTGWESEISETLMENIKTNEPRINNNFKLSAQVAKADATAQNDRQYFIISVTNMVLNETNEKIADIQYSIVFSPISISS